MNITTDAIMAICGLIIAIGGAGVYVKKVADAIRRPLDEVRADIKDMKKDRITNEKYFKNDAARLDEHDKILRELQQDNKMMLRSVMLLLSHAETGNNTGEVGKGRKELEDYLIKK
jgi:hypothetical protein